MDIQFYLKRPNSPTPTSIFARIIYNEGRLKYYLPESINPAHWNTETHKAIKSKDFPEYPEFNTRLENIQTIIKNTHRRYLNDNEGATLSPEVFKNLLDIALNKKEDKTKQTFFVYYNDFIERSKAGQRISPKTKKATVRNTNKSYGTTFNHLKTFGKTYKRKIDFETIDLEFYNDYIKYLINTAKLSPNSLGSHIKHIKVVLREAQSRGIKVNPAFESEYFTKPQEESESIYLTEAELRDLAVQDLSNNEKLERVRDLFLIGCYTGLRYSDYSILKANQIQDGFIEVKQTKTGKAVVIPVHPIVKGILDKYNGQLPPSISNQKTNDYLKELGENISEENFPALHTIISKTFTKGGIKVTQSCPKWALITTHTARRSFATNEYLAGTPSITIMAITGHKTEKSFLKYIKLTPKEHANLLKMHWDKRNQPQIA